MSYGYYINSQGTGRSQGETPFLLGPLPHLSPLSLEPERMKHITRWHQLTKQYQTFAFSFSSTIRNAKKQHESMSFEQGTQSHLVPHFPGCVPLIHLVENKITSITTPHSIASLTHRDQQGFLKHFTYLGKCTRSVLTIGACAHGYTRIGGAVISCFLISWPKMLCSSKID